jgi:hypothetical protein
MRWVYKNKETEYFLVKGIKKDYMKEVAFKLHLKV